MTSALISFVKAALTEMGVIPARQSRTTLAEVNAALLRRGIQDVKFCWAPDAFDRYTAAELGQFAADALQAYLDGKYTVMPRIGDAPVRWNHPSRWPIPIVEARKNDPAIEEAMQALKRGEISLS